MKGEVTASNDGDAGAELGDTPRRVLTAHADYELDEHWTARVGFRR